MFISSLLIYNLISENQGLEKSRSISNAKKLQFSLNLGFFQGQVSTLKKTNAKPEKNQDIQNLIFLAFEIDLDFSRP